MRPMSTLTHERYCQEILAQTEALRGVLASGATLGTRVPTCPEWTLDELLRHTGGALRWSAELVRTRATEDIPEEKVPQCAGPAEQTATALADWLDDSGRRLAEALREAGPETPVWTWAWRQDAGFWARRMTHELAVHRADATLAAGLDYQVDPEVAADALDEWLEIVGFAQRTQPEDEAGELRGAGRSIHLHATDAPEGLDAEWLITFHEDGFTWERAHGKATVALRGPLTALLLAFYRRRTPDTGGLEVLGDRELLDFWLARASFG